MNGSKVIYVETRKYIGQDEQAEPMYQVITQKLAEFGVFDVFCDHIMSHGYKSSKVVGVYDTKSKELLKGEDDIAPYAKKLEDAKTPVKAPASNAELKNDLEKQKNRNDELEARLAEMESLMKNLSSKEEAPKRKRRTKEEIEADEKGLGN